MSELWSDKSKIVRIVEDVVQDAGEPAMARLESMPGVTFGQHRSDAGLASPPGGRTPTSSSPPPTGERPC